MFEDENVRFIGIDLKKCGKQKYRIPQGYILQEVPPGTPSNKFFKHDESEEVSEIILPSLTSDVESESASVVEVIPDVAQDPSSESVEEIVLVESSS